MDLEYGEYIPIFVISHDKVEQLKKSLDSYKKYIKTPHKIIIFNHNTTYPPCLEYYEHLKSTGISIIDVYDEECKSSASGIRISRDENLMKITEKYMIDHPELNYFVVTDCDVELCPSDGKILDLYVSIFKHYKKNNLCIGTSLKLDDIPDYYPKKEYELGNAHLLFGEKVTTKYDYNGTEIKLYKTAIDTTFKLLHKSFFDAKKKVKKRWARRIWTSEHVSYRSGEPYMARHLDWYEDPNNLGDDIIYYKKNALNNHAL